MRDELARIIRQAAQQAPGECGCVGPAPGEEHCRCELQLRKVIAGAVEAIGALVGTARQEERERCAQIAQNQVREADSEWAEGFSVAAAGIASAIRAQRG